jgi:hypothetical protein
MNHLLSGTTLAVALAIAAPVWAQTPTTPNPAGAPSTMSQPAPSTSQTPAPRAQQAPTQPRAPSATAPAPSSTTENATEPMPKRHAMHRAHHGRQAAHTRSTHRMRHAPLASRGSSAPSDNIANQLNSQELGRVSGSSAPPAGYAPQGYPQQGQPQGYPQQGQPPSGRQY